jgi:NADP-dependent 3-hydroxy acid dehydrogenase YdfG
MNPEHAAMDHFDGRGAFITGGASGIGLGMAKAFARAGMKVAVADIRDDHLQQARAELDAVGALSRARFIKLDVTDRQAYAAAVEEAEAAFGKIHVLCNNAGIGLVGPIGEASYDDWDWAVQVNLDAVFNGVHTLLPRIRAHGEGGHIVNTASMAGLLQYSRAGLYVATKFAVVGLSEALHAELAGENIGVSAFCPGGVRSNIREFEKVRPERYADSGLTAAAAPAPPPISDEMRQRGSQLTADADAVGERVLDGIRRNALYNFTAPEFRPGLQARFEAILAALGEDEERTRTALEVMPNLVGSPIYRDSLERL